MKLRKEDSVLHLRRRLAFEPALIAEMRGVQRSTRRTISARLLFTALTGALVAVGATAMGFAGWTSFVGSDSAALQRISGALLEALRSDNLELALAVSAESEEGIRLLESEQERVSLSESRENSAVDATRASLKENLTELRDQLKQQGVEFSRLTPLAFGGVRARIQNPETMNRPVTVVVGDVFFAVGEVTYGFELTARRCGADYIITEVWQCSPMAVQPDSLREYTQALYRAVREAPGTGENGVRISGARCVYVAL
ncbi:MAG: TMF family protein [Candidatus Hydrogenedentes bacterium]|nr:TMF family protein [Candidatus Hydrogenedentota bacterium]